MEVAWVLVCSLAFCLSGEGLLEAFRETAARFGYDDLRASVAAEGGPVIGRLPIFGG